MSFAILKLFVLETSRIAEGGAADDITSTIVNKAKAIVNGIVHCLWPLKQHLKYSKFLQIEGDLEEPISITFEVDRDIGIILLSWSPSFKIWVLKEKLFLIKINTTKKTIEKTNNKKKGKTNKPKGPTYKLRVLTLLVEA